MAIYFRGDPEPMIVLDGEYGERDWIEVRPSTDPPTSKPIRTDSSRLVADGGWREIQQAIDDAKFRDEMILNR